MRYKCSKCEYMSLEWMGKCPSCGEWSTFIDMGEEKSKQKGKSFYSENASKIYSYSEILKEVKVENRIPTGISEVDRVLGEGFVKSQVVLLSGDPGIGKSTLLLEILLSISKNVKSKCVYVSGEESIHQVGDRVNRISKGKLKQSENLLFLSSTNVDVVISGLIEKKPSVVVFDSLQTILGDESVGVFGGSAQLKESLLKIVNYCKSNGVVGIVIGHVNKEGDVSGPIMIEHMVDTVLYLEGEESTDYRILRTTKNRFGKVSEIGVLLLNEDGIKSVSDEENIFVVKRDKSVSGVAKGVSVAGVRPFLLEVQALCDYSDLVNPRRVSKGIDFSRLQIICSILLKYTKYDLRKRDVYVNIPGGLKILDGGLDFSIAMAIVSSYLNKSLGEDVGVIGELSLTGEILLPGRADLRVSEMLRRGVKKIYISSMYRAKNLPKSVKIVKVSHISDVLSI